MLFVGKDLDRIDAVEKVLGRTAFSYDQKREDMLFGCVFRSDRPHALIKSIDTAEALGIPGVVRIFSYKDIPGQNLYGAIRKDQLFLAEGRVRYAGEPVLLVVGRERDRGTQGRRTHQGELRRDHADS